MSGRAINQVNSLRALFEPNGNSASPSSRDRSPVGPEAVKGNESRPVSKVRTSFIAVDRIGPMAPAAGLKKVNDEENNTLGQSGGDQPPPVVNGMVDESPVLNGEKTVVQSTSKDDAEKIDGETEPNQPKSAEASVLDQPQTPSKNANANKAGSNAGVGPDKLNNTVSSEPAGNVETSGHSDQPHGLGDILKGAPFENEAQQNSEASGAQATGIPESESSPPKQKVTPKAALQNGQFKKRLGPKTSSPPKSQSGASRPPAIDTKRGGPTELAKPSALSPTDAKKSPRTPGSPDVTSRQPPAKAVSPRQSIPAKASNNAGKDIRKAPIPKQPQAAAGAKAPTAPASKLRVGNHPPTTNPVKKTGPSSPTLKIRPKSPTRLVRLPAAATAATASSAAKTGEAAPPRPLSRASTVAGPKPSGPNRVQPSGTSREGVTNASSSLRKSSSRPSLPAVSNPTQKAKARTSMASAKAPEGSFLARMMRPTQSSASKAHEKVEHAAVPVKPNPSKPKRKSGGSDEQGQGPDEALPPSTTQQDEQQTPPPTSAEEQGGETVNGTEAEPKTSEAVEG